jgi:hypothetical protein
MKIESWVLKLTAELSLVQKLVQQGSGKERIEML